MLSHIGGKHILLALSNTFDIGSIVFVGGQGNTLSERLQTCNATETLFHAVGCLGILANQSYDEFFLTSHRVEGNFVEPVIDHQSISPSCIVDEFQYLISHYSIVILFIASVVPLFFRFGMVGVNRRC